jgi:uncharacterized protein YaaR (DUF327 family)
MIEKTSADLKKDEKLKIKTKKKARVTGHTGSSFTNALQSTINFEFQGSIDELLTDLKQQEDEFLNKQSLYELSRYKAIVQKILKTVLQDGFTTATLKRNRRDRADFSVIKKIDSKLLEISSAVTRNNKAFNLLKTIEEIRGLIFDLVF